MIMNITATLRQPAAGLGVLLSLVRRRTNAMAFISKICPTLLAISILLGCQSEADAFFTGRPSGMSMVHNRIMDGSPDAMLELLKVPSRFPGAQIEHIANWQNSVIAWWQDPEKRKLMKTTYKSLSNKENSEILKWINTESNNASEKNKKWLNEIKISIEKLD